MNSGLSALRHEQLGGFGIDSRAWPFTLVVPLNQYTPQFVQIVAFKSHGTDDFVLKSKFKKFFKKISQNPAL